MFTKGGKWKIVKDLKNMPTHEDGGVDLFIGSGGVYLRSGNSEYKAADGVVVPSDPPVKNPLPVNVSGYNPYANLSNYGSTTIGPDGGGVHFLDALKNSLLMKPTGVAALDNIPLPSNQLGVLNELKIGSGISRFLGNLFGKTGKSAPAEIKGLTQEEAAISRAGQVPQPVQYNPSNNLIIKSIEDGSPLEKQLNKNGEININSLTAHIGKNETSKADKYILQKVLDEHFPNKTSINYNEFKNKISDELVPLENKTLIEDNSNVGVSRLGYPNARKASFDYSIKHGESEVERLNSELKKAIEPVKYSNANGESWIETSDQIRKRLSAQLEETIQKLEKNKLEYSKLPKENKTITFSNEQRFGRGSADHYDEGTLGHSRYLVSNEEPHVFHSLEVQSDYYQKNKIKPIDIERHQKSLRRMEELQNRNKEVLKTMKEKGVDEDGIKAEPYQIKQLEDLVKSQEASNNMKRGDIANFEQKRLLGDKHLERLLQENVDFASKNGQTVMRYPTSETAAKIQGYKQKDYDLVIKELEDLRNGKISDVSKLSLDTKLVISGEGNTSLININDATPRNYKEVLKDLDSNPGFVDFLKDKKGIKGYLPEHQTILKKYDETPKMVKKVLGQDTKIVTDSKGNTWHEFDIPKSFKEGNGKIKALGTIPAGILGGKYLQENQGDNKGGVDPVAKPIIKAANGLLVSSSQENSHVSFTRGGKWSIVKDLKNMPTHERGGVDLSIGPNGVNIRNGDSEFMAADGVVFSGDDPIKKAVTIPPTTQDSLDLYNNAQKVLDFYDKSWSYKNVGTDHEVHNLFSALRVAKDRYKERIYNPQTQADLEDRLKMSDYYSKIDENKFNQRELANAILNPNSPFPLYDKRIEPTEIVKFNNRNVVSNYYGDHVQVATYDPLTIKPWSLLTPSEKAQRMAVQKAPTPPPDSNGMKYTSTLVPLNQKQKVNQDISVPPVGAKLAPKGTPKDLIRNDGTLKGNGYLGHLKMTDGSNRVMSEMSIGVEIDGKETDIPTIVPTLAKDEVNWLLKGGDPNDKSAMGERISKKAIDHAYKRIGEGKPVFADNPPIKKTLPGVTITDKSAIYTENPNDPKLKMYNDSLSLYNQYRAKDKKAANWYKENLPKALTGGNYVDGNAIINTDHLERPFGVQDNKVNNKILPIKNRYYGLQLPNLDRKPGESEVQSTLNNVEVYKKPTVPVKLIPRAGTVNPLPNEPQLLERNDVLKLPDIQPPKHSFSGEYVKDFEGVPNVKVVYKRVDGKVTPVEYENAEGDRIPYGEKLKRNFQYPNMKK